MRGLDFDVDSIGDPDFTPDLHDFEDEVLDVEINFDDIMETLESVDESAPSHDIYLLNLPMPRTQESTQRTHITKICFGKVRIVSRIQSSSHLKETRY